MIFNHIKYNILFTFTNNFAVIKDTKFRAGVFYLCLLLKQSRLKACFVLYLISLLYEFMYKGKPLIITVGKFEA